MKRYAILLTLACVSGCATTAEPQPVFTVSYVGEAGAATLTLDVVRELPLTPESGWMNAVDQSAADGRFRARKRGPVKFELEPNYVAFQEARDGEHPNGKYSWRDGVLTICMLTLTPGAVGDKLAFRFDYDTCAVMTKKVK
jgi:hypothetical protein